MRFICVRLFSVFLLLAFLTLPAFGGETDSVPRITPLELNEMIVRGDDVLILDVKGGFSREKDLLVIKGAARKALAELYRGEGLPTEMDREIVTYCT